MSKGIFFHIENNAEMAGAGEELTADTVLAAETGAADAVQEVESASGDVTEVVTGIENASEAASELGEIQGSLEEAVADGEGINEREAEHIQARLERVVTLLGSDSMGMPATFRRENFGKKQSALAATKQRLEFVKKWAAKVWEAIVKAWEWAKSMVAKLVEKVTGSAGRLEERLKALQKQIADAEKAGKTLNTEKIKSKAGLFSIDGVTSAETVKKFLENGSIYAGIMGEVAKSVAPGQMEKLEKGGDIKAHSASVAAAFDKGTTASTLPAAAKDSKGLILLPNNQAVIAVTKKAGENEYVELTTGKASEKAATEYTPLSYAEMKSLLSTAMTGVSGLKAFQKIQKDLDAVTNANIAHAKSMIKAGTNIAEANAGDDAAAKKAAGDSGASIKALHDLSVKAVALTTNVLPKAIFDVLSGTADVIAASLSGGKAPEADKKEDEKK